MIEQVTIPEATLTPSDALQFGLKSIRDLCITSTEEDRKEGYYSTISLRIISILVDLINSGVPIVNFDTKETISWDSGIPDVEIEIMHHGNTFCTIWRNNGCLHITDLKLETLNGKRNLGYLNFDLGYALVDGKPTYSPHFIDIAN